LLGGRSESNDAGSCGRSRALPLPLTSRAAAVSSCGAPCTSPSTASSKPDPVRDLLERRCVEALDGRATVSGRDGTLDVDDGRLEGAGSAAKCACG